jgi:hypothetical protein
MTTPDTLIDKLERKIEQWETLALEARTRADQCRPGDMNPVYLYGCADQLEHNAHALREVLNEVKLAKGV